MPRKPRQENYYDIVNRDTLIQRLLEYYQASHSLEEAQEALTDFNPDDVSKVTYSLRNVGLLNISAEGSFYRINGNGAAHLKRLQQYRHHARRQDPS